LAVLLAGQHHHGEALHHAKQALQLYRAAGHRSGQAYALNCIGWDHTVLGNPERGLASCIHALTLQREIGDRRGQAATLDSLGYAYHHLREYPQANAYYEQATALYHELADQHSQADTLTRLGDTLQAAGDPDAAERAWLKALTILDQLDHPDADGLHAKLQPPAT
jgi:tetratricopeptide (TPR) repeat protein